MSITLARAVTEKISAIEVRTGEDGARSMGLLTQITPKPGLRVCGPGFNDRTVQVEFHGLAYYVFREDWARFEDSNTALAAAGGR
jgi:hypothetical protein